MSLERLGLENPSIDLIKVFGLHLWTSFNNAWIDLSLSFRDRTPVISLAPPGRESDSTSELPDSSSNIKQEDFGSVSIPDAIGPGQDDFELALSNRKPILPDQLRPSIRQNSPQASPPPHASGPQQGTPKAPVPTHLSPSAVSGGSGPKIPLQTLQPVGATPGVRPPLPPVEEKYLLLCMHESEHLVVRDDVKVTNINYDQRMFQSIKAEYTRRRQKLRLTALKAWLGIKRPLGLSFVKASQTRVR